MLGGDGETAQLTHTGLDKEARIADLAPIKTKTAHWCNRRQRGRAHPMITSTEGDGSLYARPAVEAAADGDDFARAPCPTTASRLAVS